jgi:hypothetical protein
MRYFEMINVPREPFLKFMMNVQVIQLKRFLIFTLGLTGRKWPIRTAVNELNDIRVICCFKFC